MAYVNRSGEDNIITQLEIQCSFSKIFRHAESPKIYNPQTGEYVYETYHYVTPIYQYTIFTGQSIDIRFDTAQEKLYASFGHYVGMQYVEDYRIYSDDGTWTFTKKSNEEWKETVIPSIQSGYSYNNWRTKLKANAGKTDLAFNQSNVSNLKYYCNDTYIGTNALPWGQLSQSVGYLTGASFRVEETNTGEYDEGTSDVFSSAKCDRYNWKNYNATFNLHNNDNPPKNTIYKISAKGHKVDFSYSGRPQFVSFGSILNDTNASTKGMSYKYIVDTDTLPNNVINELEFSAIGHEWKNGQWVDLQWTGAESPEVYYQNQNNWIDINRYNISYHIDSYTASPNFDSIQGQYFKWQESNALPSQIGNVTCLNPELINDYTQTVEISETTHETEEVRNNIFKIIPQLQNTVDGVAWEFRPKKLVDIEEWQLENCFFKELGDETVICSVDTDDFGNEYITGVPENATITITELSHPQYDDESGETDWQYRQRHFTKARFIQFNTLESPTPEPEFDETGHFVKYKTDADWQILNLPIHLICEAYGDIPQTEWKIKRTGQLKWQNNSQHYDCAVYDLHKFQEGSDYEDDYFSNSMCENYKIFKESETEGEPDSVYREEQPNYSNVYTPNLVGTVKFELEAGKIYKLGELVSFIGKEYLTDDSVGNGIKTMARDEFKEPDYVGDHFPHPEGEEDQNHEYYMNNYWTQVFNGKRAYQIPQATKDMAPNYQVDNWSFPTLTELKGEDGNRMIYPRDDLGEIHFDVQEYEPDEDGDYPINALFNGGGCYVFWLKELTKENDTYTIKVVPRVDTFSGSGLADYINSLNDGDVAEIHCVGQYGAFMQGIVAKLKTHITDTSDYNSEEVSYKYQDHYLSEPHGTATTVELYDNIQRTFTEEQEGETVNKVVDGVKYNITHYKGYGNILRNRQEKILKDSRDKILVGGDYYE